jgi:hypothetical protein
MPPKTKQKMSIVAKAELGLDRTCVECHETKAVGNKTFCLSKRTDSLRDWATVCRVCQGVAASEKGDTKPEDTHSTIPEKLSLKPKRKTPRQIQFDEQETLIDELYTLNPERDRGRLEEVKLALDAMLAVDSREKSFRLFVRIMAPLVAGWMTPGAIHDDIIAGLLSENKRRLIIATRFSAKSTLCSIYCMWRIYREPLIKILVVSKGAGLAKRMLRTVRQVYIENCPLLEALRPNDDCLDNAEQFQVPATLKVTTGGATFTSMGRTSNVVGLRSDLTVTDDIEGTADDDPEKVVQLEEDLNELHMINPKGEKLMLGTYQSEFSLYAKLADLTDHNGEPIWELHRALMFQEDKDEKGRVIIHSRWPEMFSDADALDWRKSVTLRAWRLHVMLIADPSILNERPLKISDLILVDWESKLTKFPLKVEPGGEKIPDLSTWAAPKGDGWIGPRNQTEETVPYACTVAAIDPASGLAGRDAIGVAILSVTPGGFGVIRHLEGVRGPTKADNMRRVASIVADFKSSQLVVEETAEGLFGETLEGELVLQGYPMTVEKVTTGTATKGRRIIESLAPPMGAGRLAICRQVAASDHGGEFVNQLVRISYDGRTGKAKDHDDIVDALSHAVHAVKYSLISDIASNISDHHAAKLDDLRYVPTRHGGLGGIDPTNRHTRQITMGTRGPQDDLSIAERLIEDDEVLIVLQTRRDNLQSTINHDLRSGKGAEARMIQQVKGLTKQIDELKSFQVM